MAIVALPRFFGRQPGAPCACRSSRANGLPTAQPTAPFGGRNIRQS